MFSVLLLTVASLAQAPESPELPVLSPEGHFEFQSDRWLNLHHFLYHWSRAHDGREQKLWGRVRLDEADTQVDLGEDQEAWNTASAAYLRYADRALLNGEGMRQLKVAISRGPDSWPDETPFRELKAVMPLYEAHWWPRHHARNLALIQHLLDQLETREAAIAQAIAQGYESSWPDAPISVQVSYYTNWAGAYTSWGPNLVMMASSPDHLHGPHGLEILFHESGHTVPLGEKVRPLSLALAEAEGVPEGDVWHALLFHITGEAVKSSVGAEFVPYAVEFGLWQRGNWNGYYPVIQAAFDEAASLKDRIASIHKARQDSGASTD